MTIIALGLYIRNNSLELATSFKNAVYRWRNKTPEECPLPSELADVYRVKSTGSGKETEEFDDFNKYRPDIFNEENYNPPTGIFTHESEMEDMGGEVIDIYDNEVAR